jgi:hypothetical protein
MWFCDKQLELYTLAQSVKKLLVIFRLNNMKFIASELDSTCCGGKIYSRHKTIKSKKEFEEWRCNFFDDLDKLMVLK